MKNTASDPATIKALESVNDRFGPLLSGFEKGLRVILIKVGSVYIKFDPASHHWNHKKTSGRGAESLLEYCLKLEDELEGRA